METNRPQLLDTAQAAEFLGLMPATLAVWRCLGRYDLPFLKVGRRVLYDAKDLLAWLEKRKVRAAEPEKPQKQTRARPHT